MHTLPNNTAPMYIPDWLAMVAGSWWVKTLLDQRKKKGLLIALGATRFPQLPVVVFLAL